MPLLPEFASPSSGIIVAAGHPSAGVRTVARILSWVADTRGDAVRLVMPGEPADYPTYGCDIVAAAPTVEDVRARVAEARVAGRTLTLLAIANGGADELALTYAAVKVAAEESAELRIVVAPNRLATDRAMRSAHAVAFAVGQWLDRVAEVASPIPNEPMLGPCLNAGIDFDDVIPGTPLGRAAGILWTLLTSNARLAAALS